MHKWRMLNNLCPTPYRLREGACSCPAFAAAAPLGRRSDGSGGICPSSPSSVCLPDPGLQGISKTFRSLTAEVFLDRVVLELRQVRREPKLTSASRAD